MMGMVKLFVRNGVQVVQDVYQAYQQKMAELGMPGKEIVVAIVHHANLKINQLKEKTLQREGIRIPMPWLLNDFGNVSAASNMIAFLRKLSSLNPGDNILFDGFGAGTYYDVLAVELARACCHCERLSTLRQRSNPRITWRLLHFVRSDLLPFPSLRSGQATSFSQGLASLHRVEMTASLRSQ